MVMETTRCPQCGFVQMSSPTCKSCGAALGGPPPLHPLPKAEVRAPHPGGDGGSIHQLSFHGAGGSLLGIYIVNFFLTILTLGVYSFWGRVKVRKYFHSQTEIGGDRFAYHGTGGELLIGWLKAILLIGVPFGVVRAIGLIWEGVVVQVVMGILFYLVLLVVIPIAIVGSRRYRLSRTSWREIRFSFRGRVKDFIRIFVPGSLLTAITLGLYTPYFQATMQTFLVSHSYFGTRRFDFDGTGSDLFGRYLLALVLFPLTLGVYWFWFAAWRQRYYWAHTSFATARFRSTVTGGRFFGLALSNLLVLIVTFGLGVPWVKVRTTRFVFAHLALEGALDLTAIQQEAQAASATGEGLTEFLDVGILDMDLGL